MPCVQSPPPSVLAYGTRYLAQVKTRPLATSPLHKQDPHRMRPLSCSRSSQCRSGWSPVRSTVRVVSLRRHLRKDHGRLVVRRPASWLLMPARAATRMCRTADRAGRHTTSPMRSHHEPYAVFAPSGAPCEPVSGLSDDVVTSSPGERSNFGHVQGMSRLISDAQSATGGCDRRRAATSYGSWRILDWTMVDHDPHDCVSH